MDSKASSWINFSQSSNEYAKGVEGYRDYAFSTRAKGDHISCLCNRNKYMITEEGKDNVLHSIGTLWHSHKSRIKKKHYSLYNNIDDRWKYRPTSIPNSHFKDLLEYWDVEEIQDQMEEVQT